MKHVFSGTGVALVTPFNPDSSIDYEGLEVMVNNVIDNNIDYIVALGTTAETPTLSFAERKQILKKIVRFTNKRVPVVVGIGCNNPIEVIEQIHFFDLKNVDAVLSVTPYYNRPQQEGIIAHYKAIAQESPLPIIIYNVGSRTAVNIEAETTLRIAKEIPKVIGIKEASGNLNQIMNVINRKPKDFLVISGDDALTLPLLACGADGVISVVANAYPDKFSEMVRLALDGNFEKARKIHYLLLPIIHACFKEGSPAGVKTFLALQEKIKANVRLPLTEVSLSLSKEIKKLLS
ncbi:MAG TPA: 4-hydroxy-tetrahydrodipicolinate synthase [Bacteroidales bacterium]|jgi:4-hydroxy-tetrahydrodipicolinate synthase|nr:4-hydroxy-tetrahydrodipicolinate synthase [Bacteroidales bacterium]